MDKLSTHACFKTTETKTNENSFQNRLKHEDEKVGTERKKTETPVNKVRDYG
jgi:hypothetical protein